MAYVLCVGYACETLWVGFSGICQHLPLQIISYMINYGQVPRLHVTTIPPYYFHPLERNPIRRGSPIKILKSGTTTFAVIKSASKGPVGVGVRKSPSPLLRLCAHQLKSVITVMY